jgi:hypothetical protein
LPDEEVTELVAPLERSEMRKPGWVLDEGEAGCVVGPPPPVIELVLVIMRVPGVLVDKFPPTGSSPPPVVVELDVRGVVLAGNVDELGEELGVVALLVLERGSVVVEGGADEDALVTDKLGGTSVPVTDVIGALEAGVSVEGVGGGLLEEGAGTPLLGELEEELVAMDEFTVTKLEMVGVEERSSGDDAEADDVKLGNKVGE